MIICSCKAVSERTIRATVAAGARSPQEIAAKCGAGSRCGGCWPALQDLVRECGGAERPTRSHSAA